VDTFPPPTKQLRRQRQESFWLYQHSLPYCCPPHQTGYCYSVLPSSPCLQFRKSQFTPCPVSRHTTSFPFFTNQTILKDLKNTTDDALPNYLHSLKFKQIHTQTDVRLAIGYVAVAIAGALFFFDWKFGWDASRPYTAPAVAAYFILNGAFSYWLWFVEKGVVYEGEGKTGKVCVYLSTAYMIGKSGKWY
jgi:hypothetical protein